MTEQPKPRGDIWEVADRLQMNHRAMGAQIVELRAMMAALGITADAKPPRPGSPRELAPDVCPTCHIGNNVHTGDCPQAPRNQGRAA